MRHTPSNKQNILSGFTLPVFLRALSAVCLLACAVCLLACSEGDKGSGAGDGDGDGDTGGTSGDGDTHVPGTGGTMGTGGNEGTGASGTGGAANPAAVDTYVYMGSGTWGSAESGLITVYKVNRDLREVTFVSSHDAGGLASYLAVDVERLRLFAADEDGGGVLSFTIDPETGSLSPNGTAANSNQPVHLSLTSAGSDLLAANYGRRSFDVYPIPETGQTQVSVQSASTGQNAHSIVINSASRVLVANKGADTISHFTFAGGTLTPAAPTTTAHASPRHLVFGPQERAYVSSEDADHVTAYTVESDGSLSENWQEPRLPVGESGTGADVRVTPSGQFVYATNRDPSNTIVVYQASSGTLVEHESALGNTPRSLAMDPQGKFVVVGNQGSGTFVGFAIEANGELEHMFTEAVDVTPYFVTIVDIPRN